ncbi:MAG: hypothetical protein PHP59_10735 [Methanofollis sp.]|uniref:hypothetical protein n=1 Tax=Methanofollis sp. TaxID=2052835 RepID=UPI00261A481F|nr:hypothetical protein [Methanofollis sp.]MDD4255834.1 hypothetical protein [Methanofollis sp.]
MDLTFDETLFNKIIVVLVIAIVIVGAVAALRFSGLLGGDGDVPEPDPVPGEPGPEPSYDPDEQEVVTGLKSYAWSYCGSRMEMDLYIPNATYQRFLSSSYGTYEEKPERMAEYVVTDGDDGIISTLAGWFLETSLALGYGDSDTVGNVLAFAESLNYTTDEERHATGAYPNYPVITLATGEGDSEDHTVLAAAILNRMGYGVGLLYYPATHDRRTIIPEATALALITDGTVPGRVHWTVAEAPAGKLVYHPGNATCSVTPPEGADLESGWYSGEAVWHNATSSGHVSDLRYYPANLTFVTGATPVDAHTVVVEDAIWNQLIIVNAAWTVDSAEKGFPRSAYDGMAPFFNGGDGLWLGRPLSRDDRLDADTTIAGKQPLDEAPPFLANESLTEALRIPVSELSPPVKTWLKPVEDYYTSTWYPAGVSWTYDDRWRLHENLLEVRDPLLEDPGAYSFRGVTEVIAPVPWRITYTIRNMDSDNSKEMTPYSDARFALYRIEDGVAVFDRVFGWQTLYGAESGKSEAVFGPGDYALAVFVRNCAVDVVIEYHGKPAGNGYRGGI